MGRVFLRRNARLTRYMSIARKKKKLELGTAHKMMGSKAVPDGLLPQEGKMRSGCGYP